MNLWTELERWATILLYVFAATGFLYAASELLHGRNPWNID